MAEANRGLDFSKFTLFAWKKKFEQEGPAGLLDKPKGTPPGSRLPELTKRTILMLKQANPDWGCQRISDMLVRGSALPASASAVAKVLHEAGYQLEESPTRPHPPRETRFERAQPNQLWQTDLFTFMLKRQNRRAFLVAFMDDHSRFIVGYGLHASQSSALVIEVLRASLAAYGVPEEILTDNGSQYVTWRGKSAFSKELEKRGIRQIVAAPRRGFRDAPRSRSAPSVQQTKTLTQNRDHHAKSARHCHAESADNERFLWWTCLSERA
jgi:transposase InsO family protein